ncbi:hypothetical protein AOP6_2802 [Desulfuromonas sp. AOP6]|nr:hypothetical protein AOP6_2802 [Desulfuromonas sp. AOP6]
MGATVLVDHLSRHRRTLSFFAMDTPFFVLWSHFGFLELIFNPCVASSASFAAVPCVKMSNTPSALTGFVVLDQSHDLISRSFTI